MEGIYMSLLTVCVVLAHKKADALHRLFIVRGKPQVVLTR